MRQIKTSPFELAQRYVGTVLEQPGSSHDHPLIQWWLSLCGYSLTVHDEVPWCSAIVNGVCYELRLPRSKSAAARSWLGVGEPIALKDAEPGLDVVVIKRGSGDQPGPEVLDAQGHVGFFAGWDGQSILILGGNQSNSVSIARFPQASLLGVRRLAA
jgi:uncharacterized protein (TIGR02594 family)